MLYNRSARCLVFDFLQSCPRYYVQCMNSDYISKATFLKNAWETLRERLPEDTAIKKFDKIDFSLIQSHLSIKSDAKKNRTNEQKEEDAERPAAGS